MAHIIFERDNLLLLGAHYILQQVTGTASAIDHIYILPVKKQYYILIKCIPKLYPVLENTAINVNATNSEC